MSTKTASALDAWLDELHQLQRSRPSPQGHTTVELAAAWGVTTAVTLVRLKALIAAGRAKFAGNKPTVRIDGRPTTSPAYALVPAKRK
jgi:hypothetical protein